MEENYKALLIGLKKKIQTLMQAYESLKSANVDLASRLQDALSENSLLTNKNKELKERLDKLQLMEAFKVSASDITGARREIGKLVREIDKCIALLNDE